MTTPKRRLPNEPPFLGRSLREAFHLLMRELDAGLAAGHPDATPGGNRVMVFIDREGTSIAELARRCEMTRQSVREHVQRLEATGYVTRRGVPHHRRAHLVVLTDKGMAGIGDGYEVVKSVGQRWTEALGAEEMAQLVVLLDRLVEAVRDLPQSATP